MYYDSCHISVHLKNISKLVNFCVATLILKIEENKQYFSAYYALLFQQMQKQDWNAKRFVQCMEKVLWLIKCVKSGLQSLMLEISHWTTPHSQAGQLKLIILKSRHGEQSTLYPMGDSQHTQNTQINKVIGENEKNVPFILQNRLNGLFGQSNIKNKKKTLICILFRFRW